VPAVATGWQATLSFIEIHLVRCRLSASAIYSQGTYVDLFALLMTKRYLASLGITKTIPKHNQFH
jgi:hypothetical protein